MTSHHTERTENNSRDTGAEQNSDSSTPRSHWAQQRPSSWTYVALVIVFGLLVVNAVRLNAIAATMQDTGMNVNMNQANAADDMSSHHSQQSVSVASGKKTPAVVPTGTPDIYGKELGVRFSDVSASNPQAADATIRKLAALDNSLAISGDDLTRYINVVSKISCEYCCGADSIIFPDGRAACGCAHSFAMRGLAKYLIQNHGDEVSDDQILEELGKWKTLFFPAQISQKAAVLAEKGLPLNYINLASNKYRGIEQQAAAAQGSGMVGGC